MNYGNLAEKEYRGYVTQDEENKRKQRARRRAKQRKMIINREQLVSKKRNLKRIAAVLTMSVAAGFMISQFVAVHENRSELQTLQAELEEQEAITSQKIFDLEQSVDLDKIEEAATSRLGMQRPEANQIIYVNVKTEDMTEVTAGDAEGAGNVIASFFSRLGSYIVNLFSIE